MSNSPEREIECERANDTLYGSRHVPLHRGYTRDTRRNLHHTSTSATMYYCVPTTDQSVPMLPTNISILRSIFPRLADAGHCMIL
eukprot:scaffold8390_cov32-Prasinocladus_malaysianus.AAC.1